MLVQFQVSLLDVADPDECEQVLHLAESFAPIGGIFHLAMTLNDKLLSNQVRNFYFLRSLHITAGQILIWSVFSNARQSKL